jgi:hypothetical protein
MRVLLALMAVLALLVNPVTATAAQVACDHGVAAGMDMPGMPGMDHAGAQKAVGDPCCDHTGKQDTKNGLGCAQACAATCGVAVALVSAPFSLWRAPVQAEVALAPAALAHPHESARLERPPKSIA